MSNPEDTKHSSGALDIDYRETSNITHVHAAIQREKKEPLSDSVPIPFWLMAIYCVIFGSGLYYLGEYHGGYSSDVYNENAGSTGSKKAGAGGEGEAKPLTVVEQGKKIFLQNCAQCHQPTGLGVPGQFPPLAGSEFVNGTPRRLAMILLKGLQGPVTVEGHGFNGAMPPWGSLNDKTIACVLTYVRQEWGNKGGEIFPAQIEHARTEFKDRSDSWAEKDILAVPANAVLEGAPAADAPTPAPAPDTKK